MKIMIAEDEIEMSNVLVKILRHNRYSVDAVYDGETAVKYAEAGTYDAIVVDIMMPKLDGLQVVKTLRAHGCDTPVMILTAKSELEDKVEGLDSGADDYMTKPFSPSELAARVKAHINRYNKLIGAEAKKSNVIEVRGLKIDRDSRRVYLNDKEIIMPVKEYELLLFLAENPNIVFNKEVLFDRIWGMDAMGDASTVTVHIQRIRDKIDKGGKNKFIETVWGVGYKIAP